MVFKKDAGGAGYRLGGNGDPGRGFLIRTDISLTTVVAIAGILFTGTQKVTQTEAKIEAVETRIEKIEGNRFTARDGRWMQEGLARELGDLKTVLEKMDARIGRIEGRKFNLVP